MTATIDRAAFRKAARLVATREKALMQSQERLDAARREQAARCADWEASKQALRKIVETAAGVRVWP